jgi:hypothetical protein
MEGKTGFSATLWLQVRFICSDTINRVATNKTTD